MLTIDCCDQYWPQNSLGRTILCYILLFVLYASKSAKILAFKSKWLSFELLIYIDSVLSLTFLKSSRTSHISTRNKRVISSVFIRASQSWAFPVSFYMILLSIWFWLLVFVLLNFLDMLFYVLSASRKITKSRGYFTESAFYYHKTKHSWFLLVSIVDFLYGPLYV